MLRLGLTGGIASGKSTAAELMRQAGAIVLDADAIAHQLLTADGAGYAPVLEAFGHDLLDDQGQIDRRKLGAQVFADDSARLRLNALIHPLVRQTLAAAVASYRQQETAAGKNWLLVLMIPLLFESGLTDTVDLTAVVYCPEPIQLQRLMQRNGFSETEARQRMAAQLPIDEKAQRADKIIDNSRGLAELRQEVQRILGELTWEAYAPSPSAAF